MKILSLDLSLADSGLCLFQDDNLILSESITSDRVDDSIRGRYKRYYNIQDNIRDILLCEDYIDVVSIERQSFGSKGHLTDLAESKALVIDFLIKKYKNARFFEVSPMTLKSFILNGDKIPKGTKTDKAKEIIMNKCNQVYGTNFTNNNIADAYILGRYTIENIDSLKEVIVKVKKTRKKNGKNKKIL